MLDQVIRREFPYKFASDVLYHYTSRKVVDIFMDAKSCLYCTTVRELNDESEFTIGLTRGLEYVRYNFSERDVMAVQDLLKNGMAHSLWEPWIMSFSSHGDDLTQWKGYVDSKSGGYSVGFSRQALEQIIATKVLYWNEEAKYTRLPVPYVLYVFPCFYEGDDDVEKLLHILFNSILNEYLEVQAHYPAPYSWKRSATIISLLYLFAGIYKHGAFKDERETRIVLQNNRALCHGEVNMVEGKHRIAMPGIPDILKVKDCIVSICSSPHGNRTDNYDHLITLESSLGRNVKMLKSTIPYRG